MNIQIDIRCSEGTDDKIVAQIRRRTREVVGLLADQSSPDQLSIRVFHRINELQNFLQSEKAALGIVSEGESEFIAIHEAWRGYPRIHLCQERIKNLSETVVAGALQHELAHAILHGRPEFYTFRYSRELISAGEVLGLNMPLLQQCVYLLSIALKDGEVVKRLVEIGFQSGQVALLEHMLADTDSEREVWRAICDLPPQRKIAVSSFMKIIFPIVILIELKVETGRRLQQEWQNAFDWLGKKERLAMIRFATESARNIPESFQDWLEQTTLKLIAHSRL